jgi:predicted ATPase
MVGELAARHALPKDVIEGVTERTGGVPLFVEEVTRLLLERGEQGGPRCVANRSSFKSHSSTPLCTSKDMVRRKLRRLTDEATPSRC